MSGKEHTVGTTQIVPAFLHLPFLVGDSKSQLDALLDAGNRVLQVHRTGTGYGHCWGRLQKGRSVQSETE